MITGTIALPVYKSKDIAWLPMESFCRMLKPEHGWELIIFEDGPEILGEGFFRHYEEKLKAAGCKRLLYYYAPVKWPLSQKWIFISVKASETSEYFCLCAADNYYDPHMLQDAEKNIKKDNWCITPQGYFYDFKTECVLRYNFPHIVGLQMTAKTSMVREFSMEEINKGVDTWFAMQMGMRGSVMLKNHWTGILCTHGLNNVSTERGEFFTDPCPPFFKTKKKLIDIVPIDIYHRLKTLTRCLKLQS